MCFTFWRTRHLQQTPSTSTSPKRLSRSRSAASSTTGRSKDSLRSAGSSASLPRIKELLPDGPIWYRPSEIEIATHNFQPSSRIGNSVWKGVLRGASVAVLRKSGAVQGCKNVLATLCSMHHSCLAQLLGGCTNGEFVYLVYDFVTGDDLGSCLRSKHVPGYSVLSTWRSRIQVALDVAKGLEYLHQHALLPFVHKHISSRNILIVSNTLRAKIALVGVAVMTGETSLQWPEKPTDEDLNVERKIDEPRKQRSIRRSRSVKITGTQAYMPPEYVFFGVLTQQYDVFSFGVLLLELLSGQEAVTLRHDKQTNTTKKYSLVEEVRLLLNGEGAKGKLRLWIDPRLKDSYPVDDALKVAELANSCLNTDPEKRPRMSDASGKLTKVLDSARRWEEERSVPTESWTLQAR